MILVMSFKSYLSRSFKLDPEVNPLQVAGQVCWPALTLLGGLNWVNLRQSNFLIL
jgi:hypothetical protein